MSEADSGEFDVWSGYPKVDDKLSEFLYPFIIAVCVVPTIC
jgi:hypothetical protein